MFLEVLWGFYAVQILKSEHHRMLEKLIEWEMKQSWLMVHFDITRQK